MIKKNIGCATLALIITACANQPGITTVESTAATAADKISADNQQAYFSCKFERYETPCRQKVWDTHPAPTLKGGVTRETIRCFFEAVEFRGAGRLLDKEGHACGLPKEVEQKFWNRGYDVTCADGQRYIVDRDKQQWRISKAPAEQ